MTAKAISAGFHFSQSNLRDYGECKRRFLLRHVRNLQWPAPVTRRSGEWEAALRRGQRFHELVHQDELDLDVAPLIEEEDDPLLREWWHNYLTKPPEAVPEGRTLSEVELSVPLASYQLVAKFDRLVFADDGRAVVVDWKTGQRRPEQEVLEDSWKTLVYRYVLVEGGDRFNGGKAIAPDNVTLIYWHAAYPDLLSPIGYSRSEHEKVGRRLEEVVTQIASLQGEAAFAKTDDHSRCETCPYRSYCDRGRTAAADWEVREEDWEEVLDLLPEAELP